MIEAVAGKMQAGETKFDSLMTMSDDDFASHEREWRSVDGRDDCSCPRNPAPWRFFARRRIVGHGHLGRSTG